VSHPIIKSFIVPGLPHPLLVPEQNEGWGRLRQGFDEAREAVAASGADVLVIYSTMWQSVVGHQVQAHPNPEWVHVDDIFHELGSIPYRFEVDSDLAHAWVDRAKGRGLAARSVAYHGFPIDTGSVVALKLLNPDNALPCVIVSSNMYADRAETVVLGKALIDALTEQGKTAVAVVVSTLSNRVFTDWIDPADDSIHSPKDEEWNQKLLEFLGDGRLEDVAQLSRVIHDQIRIHKVVNFKPMWWLAAVAGQHNRYQGHVHAYAPLFGTGGAVVSLTPSAHGVGDKEFDEDDVEVYGGDRDVLDRAASAPVVSPASPKTAPSTTVRTDTAPKPVGAYPHARRVGDLLYLSGVGSRTPGTDAIPGGPVRDADGNPLDYDIEAQTRRCIENVRLVLEAAGSSLERVVDVTAFLIDMDRDFAGYNAVYGEVFGSIQATRTTLAIAALPTPIAVEFKVVALPGDVPLERA